ncbi:unnamed protein product [Paramecium octaurelia]|uniref:Uncharacterized protein n=1 Tax=Paramecium octaurelia TaxID=43137 RepID=A0A8S1V7T5_PAROT|nr:unnamed protein product [Paramecium octaurelia]
MNDELTRKSEYLKGLVIIFNKLILNNTKQDLSPCRILTSAMIHLIQESSQMY